MEWLLIPLVIELPFAPDDPAKCIAFADNMIVLDTPDGEDAGEVYAPVAGVVHAYVDEVDGGLGHYVKIDQGDGSYVLLAHLSELVVLDHQVVQVGQLLGYEGIEGVDNGSDVLIGRFAGFASQPGAPEQALALSVHLMTVPGGQSEVLATGELVCDPSDGHVYRSHLHWRTRPPDDLHEGHTWVRVYGENLWIDPSQHDGRWFVFPEGVYRIDLSEDPFWVDVAHSCDQAPSTLCQQTDTGAWSLCVDSNDGDIAPSSECL